MSYDDCEINREMINEKTRRKKAKKIIAVILDFSRKRKDIKNATVLDIGGSAGFAAKEIAKYTKKVFVIDIDKKALEYGKTHNYAQNVIYKEGDAMHIPFKTGSMDIVICNQVYEHVDNYYHLVEEISRILKNDGICYFGATSRFCIIEKHHNLPFLSWLPRRIANIYLHIFRSKENFGENLLSYKGLIKLLHKFIIINYTTKVIKNPKKYYSDDVIKKNVIIDSIPESVLNVFNVFLPGWILILKKKSNND